MQTPLLSLLIPTINRSEFLIRQLNYYHSVGFKGQIVIGDSSSPEHIKRMKTAISGFKGSLNINYLEFPGVNDWWTLKALAESAEAPFAAYVADDDFLVPSALDECVVFLNDHPDYTSAHGSALTLVLDLHGSKVNVTEIRKYVLPNLEEESARERMLDHMTNYRVMVFSVHRTDTWRRMYSDVSKLTDRTFGGEMLPSCLSVILGKSRSLNNLYLVRQDHAQRYLLPNKDKWVRNHAWLKEKKIFSDLLSEELARVDGISLEQSQEVIERAFDSYMVNLLGPKWQNICGKEGMGTDKLRRFAEKVPFALSIWRALHAPKKGENIPLSEYLRPGSPFREDLLPVLNSVTGGNQQSHH